MRVDLVIAGMAFAQFVSAAVANAEPMNRAAFLGEYKLEGEVKVDSPAYKKTFHPPLKTRVEAGDGDDGVRVSVERLGRTCVLHGKVVSAKRIEFAASQQCPLGFSVIVANADLTGTLESGSAELDGGQLVLRTRHTVKGEVRVGLRRTKVENGTIEVKAQGPRK